MKCPHCSNVQPDANYIGIARCSACSRAFSVYHAEGRALLEKAQLSDAIEKLEIASQFMRNTVLVFLDLARAYALNNQLEDMKRALERSYEIDPDYVIENWLQLLSLPSTVHDNLEDIIRITEEKIAKN